MKVEWLCAWSLLLLASSSYGDWKIDALKSFGVPAASEARISSAVTAGSDGLLYGVAETGGIFDGGVIFRMNRLGSNYVVLHSFQDDTADGQAPNAALTQGSDGKLYGVTSQGGSNTFGSVFRINTDGSAYSVLHHFGENTSDGGTPAGSLIEGSDGLLYGCTISGGAHDEGTVFRISKDGSDYAVTYHFGSVASDGANPSGALIEASDGRLYGVTFAGGTDDVGTAFSLQKDGGAYSVLRSFAITGQDSQMPRGGLVEARDGFLYGTAFGGGSDAVGTVFRMNKQGLQYSIIHNFSFGGDAQAPLSSLMEGADGDLYGTSSSGGSRFGGTLFKVSKDGLRYTLLKSFGSPADGRTPLANLIQTSDGQLYGTAAEGGAISGSATDGGMVFTVQTNGTAYAILRSFSRTGGDGQGPNSMLPSTDGFLYGTTLAGGNFGGGTVFKVATNGSGYNILHHFHVTNILAGAEQVLPAKLLQGSDGLLYGVTQLGGTAGIGTVFAIQRDGSSFTVLRNFTRSVSDSRNPSAALIEGSDGFLYGTSQFGGSADAGTIFKISKNGTGFVILHSFTQAATDARYPFAPLIEGSDGALYGTAFGGGTNGGGVAFKLNKNGGAYTVLHNFGTGTDGASPATSLTEGTDGLLYGSTQRGGENGGGTAFKMNTAGAAYSVLHHFDIVSTGAKPSDLLYTSDQMLYGTTEEGGIHGFGTIFRLNSDGMSLEVLYAFSGSRGDGRTPYAGIVQTAEGGLYGATANGGDLDLGLAFRLSNVSNQRPHLDTPIPNQDTLCGAPYAYTFPITTFSDPDVGQTLTYSASGLPGGISFDPNSRTFTGTPTNAGTYGVTVFATDNGSPPLSTNSTFSLAVLLNTLSLQIARQDNSVLVSWPRTNGLAELQQATQIPAASWSVVSVDPVSNGDSYEVILPITESPRFFRLQKR